MGSPRLAPEIHFWSPAAGYVTAWQPRAQSLPRGTTWPNTLPRVPGTRERRREFFFYAPESRRSPALQPLFGARGPNDRQQQSLGRKGKRNAGPTLGARALPGAHRRAPGGNLDRLDDGLHNDEGAKQSACLAGRKRGQKQVSQQAQIGRDARLSLAGEQVDAKRRGQRTGESSCAYGSMAGWTPR